jgi:hypothetical protein
MAARTSSETTLALNRIESVCAVARHPTGLELMIGEGRVSSEAFIDDMIPSTVDYKGEGVCCHQKP